MSSKRAVVQALRPQSALAQDPVDPRRPGLHYALTTVNVRPKRFGVLAGPFRLRRRYASGSNLKRAQKETVELLCIVCIISALCQKYTVCSPLGRLTDAWRVSTSSASAHVKLYLIPFALSVRDKKRIDCKEVYVDENGEEVVRLRGPGKSNCLFLCDDLTDLGRFFASFAGVYAHTRRRRPMFWVLYLRKRSRFWGYINSLELPVWF